MPTTYVLIFEHHSRAKSCGAPTEIRREDAGYIVTRWNKRGILLSFSTWMETLAHRTARCFGCANLEREYQHAIDEIDSVVRTPCPTLLEKIQHLHKWQDSRDQVLTLLHQHKASHIRRVA